MKKIVDFLGLHVFELSPQYIERFLSGVSRIISLVDMVMGGSLQPQ